MAVGLAISGVWACHLWVCSPKAVFSHGLACSIIHVHHVRDSSVMTVGEPHCCTSPDGILFLSSAGESRGWCAASQMAEYTRVPFCYPADTVAR